MDNYSVNQTRMLRTSKDTLNDYKTKWTGFVVFENLYGDLNTVVVKIDKNLNIIAGIDTGPSKSKEILRQLMVQSAMKISGSAYVYAIDTNNTLLASKMDLVKSDFSHLSDGEQANKAEMVYNEINPIVASLVTYKILPADMTELKDRIKDYRDFLTAPKTSINIGAEARDEIKVQIKKTMKVLEKLDRLMEHYREDEHGFYELYFMARIIIDYGHRYRKAISTINGKVIDFESEAIVVNAKVYFEGDEKNKVISDETGLFKIGAFKVGELVLIAEKEGFKKCEEIVFIVKGEDMEMNLELEGIEPIVPPVE